MPSRWFVPISGIDPSRVRLDFVHAAFSGWFDRTPEEHAANDKPHTVSPLTDYRGRIGVEIATLTDDTDARLWETVERAPQVRLGNQWRTVGKPVRLQHATWRDLATAGTERQWELEFVTPTTFRSGDRSSPLPTVPTIMSGLARSWNRWSGLDPRPTAPAGFSSVWVSDLDLTSTMLQLQIGGGRGASQTVNLSCCLGKLTLRCDDPEAAAHFAPLIRLAAYAGVGSMRGKGLGVTRVRPMVRSTHRASHAPRSAAPSASAGTPAAAGVVSHGAPG